MTRYTVSSYVQILEVDDHTVLAGHPFFSQMSVLEGDLAVALIATRGGACTESEVCAKTSITKELVAQAFQYFKSTHLIIPEGHDERAEIQARVAQFRLERKGKKQSRIYSRYYRDFTDVSLNELKSRVPYDGFRDVRFLIVGGCLTQLAADSLQSMAPSYKIRASVEALFPVDFHEQRSKGFDVLIFQPATTWLTSPLWDDAPFLSDEQRGERLQLLQEQLHASLEAIRKPARGKLLLVQGFSVPTFSPLGSTEFRHDHSFQRIVSELNKTIISALKNDPDAMFVDEERLLSSVGKARLMDHSIEIFSHHGPIDMVPGLSSTPTLEETFGIEQRYHAPRLFAQAFLDSYLLWSGLGRIKCVVVDQDNTLWHGVAGEVGFALKARDVEPFCGIHQALRILKQRGVLLAACSRNNEADAKAAWEQLSGLAESHGWTNVLLHRDDFVIHRVNWNAKSENIREIANALSISTDSILFIDDSAVEREEVRTALPKVRTLGENLNLVRTYLLTDPCLQENIRTSESALRTEMIKAQLARDAARHEATDERTFLRKLGIKLKITRMRGTSRAMRAVELIQRTTQFNTTLRSMTAEQISVCIEEPGHAAYTLEVSDRFTSYGIVGVCLFHGDEISAFVLSCRVIPLSPAVPFLITVVQQQRAVPIHASIVEGPRNQPCRSLYRQALFEETAPGRFVLSDLESLPPVDSTIYTIEFKNEGETPSMSSESSPRAVQDGSLGSSA